MKILLVYPPDRTLPTIPFSSLAVLQGCLRAAGHETKLRDMNVEVFRTLVTKERLGHYADLVAGWFGELDGKDTLTPEEFTRYQFLAPIAAVPREVLLRAEDSMAVMNDKQRFYDATQFNQAFDDLQAMIRFLYSASPMFNPEADDFVTQNCVNLRSFGGDPIDEAYAALMQGIIDEKPDAICMTMPFTFQFFEGLRFAKRVKEHLPDVPIIIGGCTINDYKDRLFKDPELFDTIDYAMPGEGEDAVCEMMEFLEGKRKVEEVSNLVWRDETGTIRFSTMPPSYPDLDKVAPPDFTDIPFGQYLVPEGIANLQTSRGCYYGKCTFCADSFRRNFRMRKPDLVYQDIKGIHEQTGVRFFLFWDSLAPPKTLRTVAEGIKKDALDVYWFAETKFEKPYVNPDLIQTLYDGGGRFLQFGFESGSQRVLDLIDKGNDLARVDKILDNMHDVGLKAGVSWFIGFPGEREDEAHYTYDFVNKRRDRIALSVYAGTFMLGYDTLVFADPDKFGIDIFRDDTGGWDYRYKDGRATYDRAPLDEGFRARSDLPLLCHGAYLLYSTFKVDDLEKTTGLGRFGPLAKETIAADDVVLHGNPGFTTYRFNFNSLKPLDEGQTSVARDPLELLVLQKNGQSYRLDEIDKRLVGLVDGKRTVGEVLEQAGGNPDEMRVRLGRLVNRSLVVAPRDAAAAPAASIAPAHSAA